MTVKPSDLMALKNVATPSLSALESPAIRLAVMTQLELTKTGAPNALAPNDISARSVLLLNGAKAVDGSVPEYMRSTPELSVDPSAESIRFAHVVVSSIPACRASAFGPKATSIAFGDFSKMLPEMAGSTLDPVPITICLDADNADVPVLGREVLEPEDDTVPRRAISDAPPIDEKIWLPLTIGFGLARLADPDLAGIVRVPAADIVSIPGNNCDVPKRIGRVLVAVTAVLSTLADRTETPEIETTDLEPIVTVFAANSTAPDVPVLAGMAREPVAVSVSFGTTAADAPDLSVIVLEPLALTVDRIPVNPELPVRAGIVLVPADRTVEILSVRPDEPEIDGF